MKPSRLTWPTGYDVSCSDDGRLLACLGRNVVVIDLRARRRISTSHPLSHPSHAAFSPGGEMLAVKATSGRIVLMDSGSGEVLHDHGNQREGEGSAVRFSPDGEGLVDGSWNGTFTIRRARDGAILSREHYPGEMITRVTHDRTRRSWLVQHSPTIRPGETMPQPDYVSFRGWPFSPRTIRTFAFGFHFESATLSPDGARFCFIRRWDERRVHIAEVSSGDVIASSVALQRGGTGSELAWSPDGRHIGAVADGMFVFFRAADLEVVGRMACPYPLSIAFLHGDHDVALGSWRSTVLSNLADVVQGPQ